MLQSKHYPLRSTFLPPRRVGALRISELHLELPDPTGNAGRRDGHWLLPLPRTCSAEGPASLLLRPAGWSAELIPAGVELPRVFAPSGPVLSLDNMKVGADVPQVMIEPTTGEGFSGSSCSESLFGQRPRSPLAQRFAWGPAGAGSGPPHASLLLTHNC